MARGAIPAPTVDRLPAYRSALTRLVALGTTSVASAELAALVKVNPATLRRDLSRLGFNGVRGSGYEVEGLLARIDHALGLDRFWPVAIVGAGNLGRALAQSGNFNSNGFRVVALFDVQPGVIGTSVAGLVVAPLDELAARVAANQIAVGVIATPAGAAQDVAERLVAAGIEAILNFAPTVLALAPDVAVRQVDLAGELQTLTFYGTRRQPRTSAAGGAEVSATSARR